MEFNRLVNITFNYVLNSYCIQVFCISGSSGMHNISSIPDTWKSVADAEDDIQLYIKLLWSMEEDKMLVRNIMKT